VLQNFERKLDPFQRFQSVLDRVIAGSRDIARRWAVLREVNITEPTSLTPWGQVQHATHIVQFGGTAEYALLAEDAGKPVRVMRG
jgi:hypothetical protein